MTRGTDTAPVPDGIWPPHEAFYLEAMLFCTTSGLRAADDVRAALSEGAKYDPSSTEWRDAAQRIIDGVQTLAHQGAALSRYFWPARGREPHVARAQRLREAFGVSEDSRLMDRDLRNTLEHFDERLDEFCSGLMAGRIHPTYVGPTLEEPEVPTSNFRAYYTDTGVFEVLGRRWEMQPVLDELQDLHDALLSCAEGGGRISYPDA